MPKINLFPDETTITETYDKGAISDIDGRLFVVKATDPNPLTINHRLERIPNLFFITKADKDVRVWQANITDQSFDLFRSDATAQIELLVS